MLPLLDLYCKMFLLYVHHLFCIQETSYSAANVLEEHLS